MKKHLKQLFVALFATILVCSTIIGIGCYSHAKKDASLLTKANVEAMSDGESGQWIIGPFVLTGNVIETLKLIYHWTDELIDGLFEGWFDDGQKYCRWKNNECLPGHRISLRTLCQEPRTISSLEGSSFYDYCSTEPFLNE